MLISNYQITALKANACSSKSHNQQQENTNNMAEMTKQIILHKMIK